MEESKEIVNWVDKLAGEAKSVAALETPSLSNISLRGGVMMLNQVRVPGNKLECIIISSIFQQRFYKARFDPNNLSNPDCFSLSLNGEEMIPHEASKEKQNERCDGCPKNAWGSASTPENPSRGKACKDTRRIALIPKDAKDIAKAEIAVLTLPVTSIRNWGTYVNGLAAEYRRPPFGVFTEIEVEPDPKRQFTVRFRCTGIVADEGILGAIYGRKPKIDEILMTPYDASGDAEKKADDGKTKKY